MLKAPIHIASIIVSGSAESLYTDLAERVACTSRCRELVEALGSSDTSAGGKGHPRARLTCRCPPS